MTPSRYLEGRVKRLEQKHRYTYLPLALRRLTLRFVEPAELQQARADLGAWVDARVRPSVTDTVWRPKRQGGPYRLEMR